VVQSTQRLIAPHQLLVNGLLVLSVSYHGRSLFLPPPLFLLASSFRYPPGISNARFSAAVNRP
jgi:hypothetical protein